MRILIVDDNDTYRTMLRLTMQCHGHEGIEAQDGITALELLKTTPVDAIITDILMPRMDGYRLSFEIRKDPRLRHLPIVIASGTYSSPEDARVAMETGADKFFRKPVATSEMLKVLEEIYADEKYRGQRTGTLPDEFTVMKEYSGALIRKLEERTAELERAQVELSRMNEALEATVRERTNDLTAANVELQAFNGSVSHDLNAPLRAVLVYAEIIEEKSQGEADAETLALAQNIVTAARRMNALIRNLMNLSRIKEGDLRRSRVPLNAMLGGIVARLQVMEPQREVEVVIPPDLTVEADSDLLELALENLVGNAWKYTGGKAAPRIEFGQRVEEGRAVFFVRDNGAGFDATQTTRLFKPFVRFHSSSEFPGTGIGLSIVHRVILRHGGRLWAESKSGEGAAFFFTLG